MIPYGKAALLGLCIAIVNGHSPDLNADPDDRSLFLLRCNVAADAFAFVDGFRVMVATDVQHLFGMICCPNCQECNISSNLCHYLCGRNATAEG